MRRFILILMAMVIASAAFFAGCGGTEEPAPVPSPAPTPAPSPSPSPAPAPAPSTQVIKLSSAQYLPPAHPFSPMQDQWGKDIMARTNGKVEITYYPGGSLLTAPQTADGIVQDIADIGFSHIGYTWLRISSTTSNRLSGIKCICFLSMPAPPRA